MSVAVWPISALAWSASNGTMLRAAWPSSLICGLVACGAIDCLLRAEALAVMAARSAWVRSAPSRVQTTTAEVCSADGNWASKASTCAAWLEVGSPEVGNSSESSEGRREKSRPTATTVATSTIQAVRRPVMNR